MVRERAFPPPVAYQLEKPSNFSKESDQYEGYKPNGKRSRFEAK